MKRDGFTRSGQKRSDIAVLKMCQKVFSRKDVFCFFLGRANQSGHDIYLPNKIKNTVSKFKKDN